LNLLADVFLDTIDWSGGRTTFEAIACALPVVTIPGEFMRGRESYAILRQLGVTDTVARDKAEYVDIAVRLGTDRRWRDDVIQRMIRGYASLYSNRQGLAALEEFFSNVVEKRLSMQSPA